jgi:hypothetical protein
MEWIWGQGFETGEWDKRGNRMVMLPKPRNPNRTIHRCEENIRGRQGVVSEFVSSNFVSKCLSNSNQVGSKCLERIHSFYYTLNLQNTEMKSHEE